MNFLEEYKFSRIRVLATGVNGRGLYFHVKTKKNSLGKQYLRCQTVINYKFYKLSP